jgi:hypothetical protein
VISLGGDLGYTLVWCHTLAAHGDDYRRLNSPDEIPHAPIPDDVEAFVQKGREVAEAQGRPWNAQTEIIERSMHASLMRDRERWHLIRRETPGIFAEFWKTLDLAIQKVPSVRAHLNGVVPLPAGWCTELNVALRELQGLATRYHAEPWHFPPEREFEEQLKVIQRAANLMVNGVFESQPATAAAEATGSKHEAERKTIQDWLDGDARRRPWLREQWESAALIRLNDDGKQEKLPLPMDWDAIAALPKEAQIRRAVQVTVAVHDYGSVRPIGGPVGASQWSESEASELTWRARTFEMAVYTHREWLPELNSSLVREYLAVVMAAFTAAHPAEQPTASPAASVETKPQTKFIGEGMTPAQAREKAEEYVQNHGYPGLNKLARAVGCSKSTIGTAIDMSTFLQARRAEFDTARAARTSSALPKLTLEESAVSTRPESDPSYQARVDSDTLLARLIEAATPDEAERLRSMPADKLEELMELTRSDPEQLKALGLPTGRDRSREQKPA